MSKGIKVNVRVCLREQVNLGLGEFRGRRKFRGWGGMRQF